jgi:pyruvate/2-oxoglutarate dehydrogenase complex dihydrolipoamide dehydrogenase (E3) component
MFIDPPLARIGMSEAQARANGMDLRVVKLPDEGGAAGHGRHRRPRAS